MEKTQQFYLITIGVALVFISCGNTTIDKTDRLLTEAKIELTNSTVQNCDGYYPMNKGVSFEMTSYNKKDKVEAIMKHKIIESKDIANGVIATCEMSFSDEKGNQGLEITYESKCQNGKYYFNLENMFSQMTSQYEAQGMKISFKNGITVMPNNLVVGDKLEDATMTMEMSSDAVNMEMIITISDKVVIGKETITTPAGTYDCLILTQNTTISMGKLMNITTSSKDWISRGVGTVKSESYDKNGKLDGYSLLTMFSK